ncbi:hypothetical protein AQ490_21810 [Wenjunlia vitaminophila]|uniref:SseB protein N-terminal domain-containing protein n=1 Tax=Wenjunlia vitaminophila TaxID=76728 RepID=A0A0T6LTJ3_WENVI|nr:hypothetical protein [Wenjunlia vitaminophila]KRV49132.1 hypothetical protein AQ490_21810 [Wenjunlia vitaminophila]
MTFREHVAALRAGTGDPRALVGEFRRTAVLVPVTTDGLLAARYRDIRWLYAFTDEPALARFALAAGTGPSEEWEYRTVLGARLLDTVIPSLDGPTGIVVDAADTENSMTFPPVRGIVPDAVALDGPFPTDREAGQ